jgi:outer membrane protein assembly factor BamB
MNQNPETRPMRWWMPVVILLLAVTTAVFCWSSEVPFLEPILIGIGLITVLMLGLWYVFCTGLKWKTRLLLILTGAVCLGGMGFGVARLTRIEGSIGGSGIPRLVWKWSPKEEGTGSPLGLNPAASSEKPAGEEASPAGEFPQFLGPNRSGSVTGPALARDWNSSPPEMLWRQPIGLGWSGFAVSGRRAVTQEQRGDDELVVCYETQSGRALWAHTNRARFQETLGGDGPRATPGIHQGRVYAMGGTGILDCLDLATGRLVWSRDVLGENHLSNITWGKSCSPLVMTNLVVVTGGEQREASLLAYEATAGNPVWKSGRDRASYSSPVFASLSGREQIIVVNAHSVTGHDPAKGDLLWEYDWPGEFAKATQPLVIDTNRLFIAAGYGVGCVMLRVEPSGPGWSAVPLWKNRNLKPKFTNLVRLGNHVYGLDEGVLACLDLDQGNRLWREGRYGHGQILLVEDLLLVQAESGEVALVEISPEGPREHSRLPALRGKTWNNPALAGNLLLVRNDREAACYRLPLK